MPFRTITFVRHGQSHANAGGVTMEHHAIPLTGLGRRQAGLLALILPHEPSEILVSPFDRARHTAEPYEARSGQRARVVEALREFETLDSTQLEGMTAEQRRPITEAYWSDADPAHRHGQRAETFFEFAQRVTLFNALELPALKDRTVVFGHGMWMGLMAWYLLGFSTKDRLAMQQFRRFQLGLPMPNGAIYVMQELAAGEWRLRVDEAAMRQLTELA